MDITLIDAAEGRVLARHVHVEKAETEPTIMDDLAEINRLMLTMAALRADERRIQAQHDALWARCRLRVLDRLAKGEA